MVGHSDSKRPRESAGTRELITAQNQNTLIASRVVSRYVCALLCPAFPLRVHNAFGLCCVAHSSVFFFVRAVCLNDVVHVAVLRHALSFVVLC